MNKEIQVNKGFKSAIDTKMENHFGSKIITIFLLAMVALALISPFISAAANEQNILDALLPPGSPGHILGTDELGRDVLLQTLAGAGSALVGPIFIASGSMSIAIILGTVSGYLGGPVDTLIGRIVDIFLALPVMLLALVVTGILGANYWVTVILLIFLFSPSDIRIVRSGVIEQKNRPFIEAAKMLSLSNSKIMFKHIVPNIWPLILTNLTLDIGIALVTMSSLSFLGIGVAPGTPDWGRQIADGRGVIWDNPAILLAPAILIVLVTMAINAFGDQVGIKLRKRGM